MVYSFKNDYSKIAHPKVIEKLTSLLGEQNIGYGEDIHTKEAIKLIQNKIKNDSDVYFLAGGTVTNMIAISSVLKPYEAVIAASTGHINVHETGAIEGQGHKVIAIPTIDGKLRSEDILAILDSHTDHHMVKPKMVYISNTTELGMVYTKEELQDLYKFCHKHDLYLYLDGARLASALAASNITFPDYAKYTDMFYIGGTKCGSYFGEALVINNNELKNEFVYNIKHFGGMLAKGFVTAIPFLALMSDNLYEDIGKKQNDVSKYLVNKLEEMNLKFYSKSITNQVFVYLPKKILDSLYKDFLFEIWENSNDDYIPVRFVVAFDTEFEHVDMLIKRIGELLHV